MADELLYAPATTKLATPPVDAVRAFVFTSGARWMEKRGLMDRYRALLPADLRASMDSTTTDDWISLADALRIYAACDALDLSFEDQIELGRAVSAANNGVVVTTIVRLVGRLGATPWLALRHIDRVWQRSNRGGAVAVYKIADRIARVEFWQCPLAQSACFVMSMRGAIAVGMEPFCDRIVVSEVPGSITANGFAQRLAW